MASPQPHKYTKISNEILENLAKIRIPGEARQVLDVIIRKTYGWGKKSDSIATSQFMEFTGLKAFAVHRARRKLQNMNLITITNKGNSTVTNNGNSQVLSYAFQKDYDKWKPIFKKFTVTNKDLTVTNNGNSAKHRGVTNKEVHKRNKETIQKKTARARDYLYLNNSMFKPLWDGWIEVRAKLKAPNTDMALEMALKKLHAKPIHEAAQMLEQSIERGWRGIFDIKAPITETRPIISRPIATGPRLGLPDSVKEIIAQQKREGTYGKR